MQVDMYLCCKLLFINLNSTNHAQGKVFWFINEKDVPVYDMCNNSGLEKPSYSNRRKLHEPCHENFNVFFCICKNKDDDQLGNNCTAHLFSLNR